LNKRGNIRGGRAQQKRRGRMESKKDPWVSTGSQVPDSADQKRGVLIQEKKTAWGS